MGEDFSAGESAGFTAVVERHGGVSVVRLYGEVDLLTAPRIEEALSEAAVLRDGIPGIVLDLSGVTFMDSTGIGLLVGQRGELGAERLWLVLGDGGAGRTMKLAEVDVALRVCTDLETAVIQARGDAGE